MPNIDKHAPGSFCWFELATTDQKSATAFYRGLFGWDVADTPMGPGEVYSIFKINGRDVAAGYTMHKEQREQGVPPNWGIYVSVDDVDASAKKAADLGATLLAPPFDVMDAGRMAVIQDPTGAIFQIWQAKRSVGTTIEHETHTVCWADLHTRDIARAAKFYNGLFGWKIVAGKDMSAPGPNDYGHIVNGEAFIGGVTPVEMQDPNAPPHWMIYVEVADCATAVTKAKSLGAQVYADTMAIGEFGGMAVLADPQGAVFALHHAKKS